MVVCPIDGNEMGYHTQYHNDRWYACSKCGLSVEAHRVNSIDYKAKEYAQEMIGKLTPEIMDQAGLENAISDLISSNAAKRQELNRYQQFLEKSPSW
jgi:hypothetical protein